VLTFILFLQQFRYNHLLITAGSYFTADIRDDKFPHCLV